VLHKALALLTCLVALGMALFIVTTVASVIFGLGIGPGAAASTRHRHLRRRAAYFSTAAPRRTVRT
jgi:hypothetical protein